MTSINDFKKQTQYFGMNCEFDGNVKFNSSVEFSGNIPIGGIILWSGTTAQIAGLNGWKLCDGTNGTPDLRSNFVSDTSYIMRVS